MGISFPAFTSGENATTTVTGQVKCSSLDLKVDVVSNNVRLLLDEPLNQTVVTHALIELLQAISTLFTIVDGGINSVKGTYSINGTLCIPSGSHATKHTQTIQFLTHGDTLDSTYWDIAPGCSHINAASAAGYATFSYDRIGVEKSEHPDPLQVDQGPLQVEIAHGLVTLILDRQIGPYSSEKVVGVGHSAGSIVTQVVTAKYSKDFDTIILTGTSIVPSFVNTALASFDVTIASMGASQRFSSLPNGYLVQHLPRAIKFHTSDFPTSILRVSLPIFLLSLTDLFQVLAITVTNKQTQTFGELLTLGTIVAPSTQYK